MLEVKLLEVKLLEVKLLEVKLPEVEGEGDSEWSARNEKIAEENKLLSPSGHLQSPPPVPVPDSP